MTAQILTQSRLKEVLHYCPDTGVFTWIRTKQVRMIDKEAGTIAWNGYRDVSINGKKHGCHRLAWIYIHGDFPINNIDHINGIKTDNRIENLRDVSQSENLKNARLRSDNKTGVTGVYINKSKKSWTMRISAKENRISEFHKDFFEAVCNRKSLENKLGYLSGERK